MKRAVRTAIQNAAKAAGDLVDALVDARPITDPDQLKVFYAAVVLADVADDVLEKDLKK